MRIQSKVLRIKSEQKLYALTPPADGCGLLSVSIVPPSPRIGTPRNAMGMNVTSYRSIACFSHHSYGTSISKRSFSRASGPLTQQNDASRTKDGGSAGSSTLKEYNKHRKPKKAFSADKEYAMSSIAPIRSSCKFKAPATRGPDMVYSNDRLSTDDREDAELEISKSSDHSGSQNSNATGKPKKLRSKKSKNQASDTLKRLEKVSPSKKLNLDNNNYSPAALQKCSRVMSPERLISHLGKEIPKKGLLAL